MSKFFRCVLYFFVTVSTIGMVGLFVPANAPTAHAANNAAANDFVITVKTDVAGATNTTQFMIPTRQRGIVDSYYYGVDCNNDGVDEAKWQTDDYICDYGATGLNTGPGTYTVRIKDNSDDGTGFPQIYFSGQSNGRKLLSIDQWGSNKWRAMDYAFEGCINLTGQASDTPDLSNAESTSYMFKGATAFNGNIANWNTANVQYMSGMFSGASAFNQNIGNWNTANVTDMSAMFDDASAFNQNIGNWNTASVTNMRYMFHGASAFNQNIGGWNTANVTDMEEMFAEASAFNQNIGNWNTANVTEMFGMFFGAGAFNQNIGGWNTANVTDMSQMFDGASAFNQNIGNWNTANVTETSGMFRGTSAFNQNLNGWNTGKVTYMDSMFEGASVFNGNIGNWNTAKVESMAEMFKGAAAFNQNIGNWNTANVRSIYYMFADATAFNQNIGNWNTGEMTGMDGMFSGASAFNQNIGNWNTANVGFLTEMFKGATAFNQNLGSWNVGHVYDAQDMFDGVTLATANYDALLNGWGAQTLQSDVDFDGGNSKYCAGEAARSHMIQSDSWTIQDGGKNCSTGTPTSTPTLTPTPTSTPPTCSSKPSKPTLKKPANGATVTQAKVKLDWSDSSCVTDYQVTVKNTQTGKKVFKAVLTKSKAKTGALPPGEYNWSVKARNGQGAAKSTKFTFTK